MIDEKKLGKAILDSGTFIWPAVVVFCDYFIFAQDSLLIASSSMLLSALFILRGWDWRVPAWYGIALILISLLTKEIFLATGMATYGYWLFASGVAVAAVRILAGSGVDGKMAG